MSGIHHLKQLLTLLAAWALCLGHGHAQASCRLSTRFLARGEQALLELAVPDLKPSAWPTVPTVAGVEILPSGRGPRTQPLTGKKLEYVLEFLVSSYATGSHVIPAMEVVVGGVKLHTEPVEFTVFNPDELQWAEALEGDTKIRYASAFRIMNRHPYLGQTIPVEIKIFVPRELIVEDWGIPDFQRDGVTAWRFQPSAMRGQINLLGIPYVAIAYPSTLAPTRTGKVGIGNTSIRLMTTQVVMDGILKRIPQEINLSVPPLDLDARPLPSGAPVGFENAVGHFQMTATTAVVTSQEGDPIPVDIVVTGSGNLDTLRPPALVDTQGWKTYETTTEQRGDERRQLAGRALFHEFLRPLGMKSSVPPFRLVFFDPKSATYQSITTEPLPLTMTPSTAPNPEPTKPPAAQPIPLERMTDILGVLRAGPLGHTPDRPRLPAPLGHLICAITALGLMTKALWMRLVPRTGHDPERAARRRELHTLQRHPEDDDAGFLMLAGQFIERRLGDHPSPEVQAILAERDAWCFRPDPPRSQLLTPMRRKSILNHLRSAAMTCLLAALCMITASHAQADDRSGKALAAYDSANYDEAIQQWLHGATYADLTADTLYNIGNACYRAGSPGYAALYYRRALTRDPHHPESRQNLRFIERKCGSITRQRPPYQEMLARWPLTTWQGILSSGAWLSVLAMLVIAATRPAAPVRLLAIVALVIGPLTLLIGGLGWHYFPDDAEFAPLARQAVIIADHAIAHADAARTSPEVIDAPPGSLCEVLAESGRWAYVAFSSQTRGWLPVEVIDRVLADPAPVAPTIQKPKADDKSA